ncbi:MAG: SelT/SelW/SelH family protein [Candidatus Rokubacteria bacterium]|nr:SelT/SelW/SelH family protein [Candidatus Rokubacteria bacterium]
MKKEFALSAELKAGHGGVFDVELDGSLVYSKHKTGRFPTNEEIFAKVRQARKA